MTCEFLLQRNHLVFGHCAKGSIWIHQVTAFPACFILGFMDNHYLLQRARPKWRTLKFRSEDWVTKSAKMFLAHQLRGTWKRQSELPLQPCHALAMYIVTPRPSCMSWKVASATSVFRALALFSSSRHMKRFFNPNQVRTCTLLPPIHKEVWRSCCIFDLFFGTAWLPCRGRSFAHIVAIIAIPHTGKFILDNHILVHIQIPRWVFGTA